MQDKEYDINGVHVIIQGDQPISNDEVNECVRFTKEYSPSYKNMQKKHTHNECANFIKC